MAEANRRFSARGVLPPIVGTLAAVEEPDQAAFEGAPLLPPIEGRIAAVEASPDQASVRRKKDRRMPARDPVKRVAREIWPPDGQPPETMLIPVALKKLGDECQKCGINVHIDTLRRAIGCR